MKYLLLLLLFISCQSTHSLKNKNLKDLKNAICLNTQGKGRIKVSDSTQVFSFYSFYDESNAKLDVDFTFPIYGTESISVEYIGGERKYIIDSSFEKRLVRENKEVDPILIESFLKLWAEFFEDLLYSKSLIPSDRDFKLHWKTDKQTLIAVTSIKDFTTSFKFLYLNSENYFERMDIRTKSSKSNAELKLELIVRKCLENPSKEVD